MKFENDFVINRYDFNSTMFSEFHNIHYAKDLWPIVYILRVRGHRNDDSDSSPGDGQRRALHHWRGLDECVRSKFEGKLRRRERPGDAGDRRPLTDSNLELQE